MYLQCLNALKHQKTKIDVRRLPVAAATVAVLRDFIT